MMVSTTTQLLRKALRACGMPAAVGASAVVFSLLSWGSRADQHPNSNLRAGSPTAASDPTVELAASQVNAIQIEPVGTYRFDAERDGVGNIDFDEDLAIVQAESTLVGAAATLELSSKALARLKGLYEANGGVPQKELEQAISDHETAEGALEAARDAVRVLGKTDAEIDRMVATRRVEAPHSSRRWMVANITESDTPFVRVGQDVTAEVLAYPGRTFHGKVSKVYATLDPNTHRTRIRCSIADPAQELRAGMLADFTIRVQDPIEAIALPADAVVREGDGSMTAWVTTDRHVFRQRTLTVGLRQSGHVQILAGLERGDLVVSAGGVFLSNLLQASPAD
jgi:cobalt-zinc-cadmium efflux system membrane fusion protein